MTRFPTGHFVMAATLSFGISAQAMAQTAPEGADPDLFAQIPEEYRDGLTAVYDPQYPPSYFIDENGEMAGYVIDLQKAVGAKLGLEVSMESAKFAGIIAGIMSERYDTSYFHATEERRETMDMIDFQRTGTSVMVAADNPAGLDLHELCGKTVGTATGGSQSLTLMPVLQEECAERGEAEVVEINFPSPNEGSLAVKTGRVEGWLGDAPNAAYLVRQQPEIFAVAPTADLTGWSAFAFRKGDPLAQLVKEATEQLIADGTYEEIIEGWHMKELALDTPLLNGE